MSGRESLIAEDETRFAFGREQSPTFEHRGLFLVCDDCGWFGGDANLREKVMAVCEDGGAERLSAFSAIEPALSYQAMVRGV